jgi:integrase
MPHPLSGEAIALIVKQRSGSISPQGRFSGHSLRTGFVTTAALAGIPTWKIRAQTGHASEATLSRYIRRTELFAGNATDPALCLRLFKSTGDAGLLLFAAIAIEAVLRR